MDNIKGRAAKLLSVKSIVTIALTAVFAYLVVTGTADQSFLTIYTMIVSFYFGTQTTRGTAKTEEQA